MITYKTKKIILFIGIPVLVNALLIGLYFSGIRFAQQLVAPTIGWLSAGSWREFGLPELLQNIYLLTIIVILMSAALKKAPTTGKAKAYEPHAKVGSCFITRRKRAKKRSLYGINEHFEGPVCSQIPNAVRGCEATFAYSSYHRIFFTIGVLLILFVFLEEIDYGVHFYQLLFGQSPEMGVMNWHNQETASGKQNVYYLKRIADLTMVIWFILLPLLSHKIGYLPLQRIIPSRWFIIGFVVCIISSRITHLLHGWEWDIIDGVRGNLAGNLSEFRETCNYYLYLLYAVQLSRADIFRRDAITL